MTLFWKVSQWHAKVNYDLDRFGEIIGTEKGLDRAKRRAQKLKKYRGKHERRIEKSTSSDD